MAKLHIFIDGSWLYKAGSPGLVLASKTEPPDRGIRFDFDKLDATLLNYVRQLDANCTEFGDKYLSTSIFTLPQDFDSWPEEYDFILPEHIEQTRRNISARERFVESALNAGYSDQAIYRPVIKSWIVEKLLRRRYQEKQVDATVVTLLVRSAIIYPRDYHCVITGDADMLPAIRVAYPEYSKNVLIATTHPDELRAEHRQTAFSLNNFAFNIPPLYLQDHVYEIIQGDHIYVCAHCHKVFVRPMPIPKTARPCCGPCHSQRT